MEGAVLKVLGVAISMAVVGVAALMVEGVGVLWVPAWVREAEVVSWLEEVGVV